MHEDVERHMAQAEETVLLWSQHKASLASSAKGDDDQDLVNAGLNCFSFYYSAKYSKWNFDRYLRYPDQYKIEYSIDTKVRDLLVELKAIENESRVLWHLVEGKLKKSLPKSEWKKYFSAVEAKYGSPRYAVDLGPI